MPETVFATATAEGDINGLIGLRDVEGFWVERAAGPFLHGSMLLVGGIAPGFQEVCVAARTADVLGRAMASTVDAYRVFDAILGLHLWVEFNPVQPGVAKVVFVRDARMGKVIEVEIAQGSLGCLQDLSITELVLVELGGANDEAADDELMHVRVGPAEGGLDYLVELGEVDLTRQQDPPPD